MQSGTSRYQAVLVDTGSEQIKVIKQIREILGNGLAEAKAMTENAPVLIKTNLTRWEADHIQADFQRIGAKVEIQQAGDTSIIAYPTQNVPYRPQQFQKTPGFRMNPCVVILLVILLLWLVGDFAQKKDDPWTVSLTGETITCRHVGCGRTPLYHEWNRRFCSEHIQGTRTCRYPGCNEQISNSSLYEHCSKHR